MSWKRRDTCKSIEEVILRNTGYKNINLFTQGSKKIYNIKYLKEAAEMIKNAIKEGKQITIVGDYDADGITASASLAFTLKSLGAKVKVRLPKRLSEGFGLSTKIVDEIDDGLIITVDNGIVAFEAIELAKSKGLDVIITDHHLPDGDLPNADIIIDPHLEGAADFADYCGAGIAYKLSQELVSDETVIKKISCFAAIGTICDVVPLVEENRLIVLEGLKNMMTYGCRTSGLYSLLRATELDKKITEENIGFKLGPTINAAGRLYDEGAMIVYETIVYDGRFDENLGKQLVEINDERKRLVKEGMEKLLLNIQTNCLFGDYPLVIYEPGLPEGIVGILAGRFAEEKGIPTFVFTDSEDPKIYKGSARSAGGVHLKNLLDTVSDNLYKYGGHAEAAGISVESTKFYDMISGLQENIPEMEKVDTSTVYYDLEINTSEIDSTLKELEKYAPYGEGNPRIVFKISNFELSPRYSSFYKTMGDENQHIKLLGNNMEAVGFDMTQKYIDIKEPKKLNLIGTLGENIFMGKTSTQITMDDFESAGTVAKTKLALLLEAKSKSRYS